MRRSRQQPETQHDDERDVWEDEDDTPLQHKRAFGAGLKRKRVEFVKAQDPDASIAGTPSSTASSVSIGDLYASVVLSNSKPTRDNPLQSQAEQPHLDTVTPEGAGEAAETTTAPEICAVCQLPITSTQHESSLAHQVSLAHSHPPSALDRSRMGLRALASQGWNPDARVGLGKDGEGVRYPIKLVAKDDTLGIGAAEEAKRKAEEAAKKKKPVVEETKVLTAKELKKQADTQRARGVKLQAEIFGRADLDKYLKPGKEWE